MKRKLLLAACLVAGALGMNAQTDVTTSYIGDVTWIVKGGGHNHSSSNHKESDGIGWWNDQTLLNGWHAFVAPDANGGAGESWTPGFGSAGVMMGRTMVLPAGNYTLSFDAFGCNATNSADPSTLPVAGDVVAFLTGKTDVDITNTSAAGDATFHNVSFTFDVTTANTAYEFGIKKLADDSKIDWCQIKNVKLMLNSTDIYPVPNDNVNSFTYSGTQTWHTNTWSTEGQSDGSRFQVPFHELWVASGGKLDNATIEGTYTPTQTGVYKVSAWVRAMNESGGDVTGAKIFVGDVQTDACTGSVVNSGKGRLGTYTAMADGVSGTPINYGFILQNAEINWLSFKNVTITYLGTLPQEEIDALLAQVPTGTMDPTVQSTLDGLVAAFETNASVANYNALASYISTAQASVEAYSLFAQEKVKALALGMDEDDIDALAPNVHDLMVAEYNFVTTNYPNGVELGTWTTVNAVERSGQHWDNTEESTYSEQNEGWSNKTWSCSYSQNLTLPAGNYVFKVAGRKSSDAATLTLTVKDGNNTTLGTVNDFPNGDVGKGIDTNGATNFGDGTYANNNLGRGWQWRYVKFTLADPATVNVSVTAEATDFHQWVGFCNATVQTDDADNVALMEALVALNNAKTAATLTKNTNVGTGVFQCIESSNNSLWSAYETAKTNADNYTFTASSTASEVNGLATALNEAIDTYKNQPLNAPDASKKYNLVVATASHAKEGNAVIIIPGETSGNNPTGYALNAHFAINPNLNQAVTFTQVSGNPYNISFKTAAGVTYLTYGTINGSKEDWSDSQIQATTDATKKGEFKIAATATANVFNIYNTLTNSTIACQSGGNIYTEAGNADFTIAEASAPNITINTTAAGWGTVILPVDGLEVPLGVKAYSCAEVSGTTLTLEEVSALEANKPYIIEGSWQETIAGGDALGSALTYTEGLLTGVYAATPAPVDSYVLQKNGDKVAFYQVETGEQPTVGANRAYLTYEAPAGDAKARAFFFEGDDATAIATISALTSGEVEAIYTIGGARVNSLQKGINIVKMQNGETKKVIVK